MSRWVGVVLWFISSVALALPTVSEFAQQNALTEQQGFIDLYYNPSDGKVYLHIDALDTPLLFQSSLPRGLGSNDIGLDRGQLGETRIVQFERFGANVLLRQKNTHYRAVSDNAAERASIDEAFASSVIAGLPIVAESGGALLVDYTAFLLSDIHGVATQLDATKQGNFKPDPTRSGVFLARTKAFVDNTELEALITFGGSKAGEYVKQVAPSPDSLTVHMHHSFVRLPDDGYQPRAFHPMSGYWALGYKDYAVPLEDSMDVRFIPRHRLRKQNPEAEISAPVEPIVYYLDPGVPEPVRTALLDGARWWDQAFEAIGYKGAFVVKVLPDDADPMDVRYNVIQWVHRATRGWSYGSSVIDPRSGEIIKGHVTLGSLRVRQDYLIALGLTSPFVDGNQSTEAQQQMALNRIRQLSAHEVGHTLGIAHNFAASEQNRASVMDYPHPKLRIDDGRILLDEAYDLGIGAWDKRVIAYGYQDLPPALNEAQYLEQQIAQTLSQGYRFISDPDARPAGAANPHGHLWDNGAAPVAELQHLNRVREIALRRFGLNALPPEQSLSSLEERLAPIYLLSRYQIAAVAKLIGGVEYGYWVKPAPGQPAPQQKAVQPARQVEAMNALLALLTPDYLQLPAHISALIPPKAYGESRDRESFHGRTGVVFDPDSAAESLAGYVLDLLLNTERLNRLALQRQATTNGLSPATVVNHLFDTLLRNADEETRTRMPRLAYLMLHKVMTAIEAPELSPEVKGDMLFQVIRLHRWLKDHQGPSEHQVLAMYLDWYLENGEWQGDFEVKPLPPGSPI
ncbi:zinc-dependent metalloprotease [Aestuariibacter halophilus]|uniref:Zinc-dependent metalloprotease n=1 Tax=Fluctibacter halophilus TaxID=226011 RepID=A0ABS8G7L3_9ALTE|nr:zinc-dependent metalloprotease [Aestuariibacter halophilus]MCC2616121.1 zinc-dependent metalloprotease [Aestuariibacter halophilus]